MFYDRVFINFTIFFRDKSSSKVYVLHFVLNIGRYLGAATSLGENSSKFSSLSILSASNVIRVDGDTLISSIRGLPIRAIN